MLGRYAAAIDEEIVAVGSWSSSTTSRRVFVFNISTNPAQQLSVLGSPDGGTQCRFGVAVAVNRNYGILVGADHRDIEGMLPSGVSILVNTTFDLVAE